MNPELELLLTFLLPVLLLGLVFLLMYIWVITRGMSRSKKRRTEQLKRVASRWGLLSPKRGFSGVMHV